MELPRQQSIRPFDFVIGGIFMEPQESVVIQHLGRGHLTRLQIDDHQTAMTTFYELIPEYHVTNTLDGPAIRPAAKTSINR
jgi:hypothetical protein